MLIFPIPINLQTVGNNSEEHCLSSQQSSDVGQPHFAMKSLAVILTVPTALDCASVLTHITALSTTETIGDKQDIFASAPHNWGKNDEMIERDGLIRASARGIRITGQGVALHRNELVRGDSGGTDCAGLRGRSGVNRRSIDDGDDPRQARYTCNRS